MTQRVMIQSFDWRTLALVQRLEPGMRTVYLTIESRNSNNVRDPAWTAGRMARDYASVAHMVKAAGGAIWAPNFNNIDAGSAQRAHDLGLQLVPWTVNEPADMRRLIDWGVDGIITDYPDRLREVMRERGLALPAGVALRHRCSRSSRSPTPAPRAGTAARSSSARCTATRPAARARSSASSPSSTPARCACTPAG